MTTIYDQHRAAFAQVSAFVVLDGAERVATIAFKFPRDGAGRLACFLHVIGLPMVRGTASGYGYDKRAAALGAAASKVDRPTGDEGVIARDRLAAFLAAIRDDDRSWDASLHKAGFAVHQAV